MARENLNFQLYLLYSVNGAVARGERLARLCFLPPRDLMMPLNFNYYFKCFLNLNIL